MARYSRLPSPYNLAKELAYMIQYNATSITQFQRIQTSGLSNFEIAKGFADFLMAREMIRSYAYTNKTKEITLFLTDGRTSTVKFSHLNKSGGLDDLFIMRDAMFDFNVLSGPARDVILRRMASKYGERLAGRIYPHVGSWISFVLNEVVEVRWNEYVRSLNAVNA